MNDGARCRERYGDWTCDRHKGHEGKHRDSGVDGP